MKSTKSTLELLADAAILRLVSRISGPLLLTVCTWILSSVVDLKKDVGVAMAKIESVQHELATLEDWRNGIDAKAEEKR